MISPSIFFQLINGIIGAMQVFTQAYLMTAMALVFHHLLVYMRFTIRHFLRPAHGLAPAMSWVLLVFTIVDDAAHFLRSIGSKAYCETGDGTK